MLVSVSINQLFNDRVCFHADKTTSLKGLLLKERICSSLKNMLPIGSIFFPLRVAPMRIENNFKWHKIEKPPKLNYAKISVF